MEGWENKSFQYFVLEKNAIDVTEALNWDGYTNFEFKENQYLIYTFDRKESIRLDDLLWFIVFIYETLLVNRIHQNNWWQCIILLKKLIDKYLEMKKKKITHGNLSSQTIWLVLNLQTGLKLHYNQRTLHYKVHFTGFSLNSQSQDDHSIINVFKLILKVMPYMQTEQENQLSLQRRLIPYIQQVQTSLYSELNKGIDQFQKLVVTYFNQHLNCEQQHLRGMDTNFRELDPNIREIRTEIIKYITQKSQIFDNDFINNLRLDNSIRNYISFRLSENNLLRDQKEAKQQWEMIQENEQWKQFILILQQNKNEIQDLIVNFEDSMNKELNKTFKFKIQVSIPDIKQWIKQKLLKYGFYSQIKSQYFNSSQQFQTWILKGQKVDYALIKQKILQDYINLHEQAYEKVIQQLIQELE